MRTPCARLHGAVLVAAALLVACDGRGDATAGTNVVVVTLDTVRADKLSCYGYFRETTPRLDELAAQSVLFERCLAPVSQTLPSHASLFTALLPAEHGLLANVREHRSYRRAPGARLLATLLAERGYETAAFVAAEPVKAGAGLEAGFSSWWQPEENYVRSREVVDRALAWLGEHPATAPYLLWVHVFDAHMPYEPEPPFDTSFETDEALERYLAERAPAARSKRYETHDANNLYDGELLAQDLELGRLFDALADRADWDRTLLVVVGDHGEELMQHAVNGHGNLWDVSLRVPALVRAPGLAPGRESRVIGVVDLLPTALARVPDLASLLDVWLVEGSGYDRLAPGAPQRAILSQYAVEGRARSGHALDDGRWRLIVRDGQPRLFDLQIDPHELHDCSEQNPDVVQAMSAELERRVAQHARRGEELGAGQTQDADAARVDELRELGYGGDEDEDEDGH